MLDERDIHAGILLKTIHSLRPQFTEIDDGEFYRIALYVLAAIGLDLNAQEMLQAREDLADHSVLSSRRGIARDIAVLMYACDYVDFQEEPIQSTLSSQAFRKLARALNDAAGLKSQEDLIYIFDAIFLHASHLVYGVDPRHLRITAALANGLLARGTSLIDYFAYSGEPFITEKRRSTRAEHLQVADSLEYEDLVNLRLRLYDLQSLRISNQNMSVDGLTLIDSVTPSKGSPKSLTTLETLSTLIRNDQLSSRTVVIIRDNYRLPGKVPTELIRELKERDLLEAIIDITSFEANGGSSRISAWVLNTQKHLRNRTLCVDVSTLIDIADDISPQSPAWFAAAIVELWSSKFQYRLGRYPEVQHGPLKGLFSKMFDGGYVTVPGVCEELSSTVVLSGRLSASGYLAGARSKPNWSLLDQRPLLNLLLQPKRAPVCAYVIGNNGAGKSLLLTSLIDPLDERKIPSVGIAFGQSDRFPLAKKTRTKTLFEYLGNRTGPIGHSLKEASRKLTDQLILIYTGKTQLGIFALALEHLSFKHQQYLVPVGVSDVQFNQDSNEPGALPLSMTPRDNRLLHAETAETAYELALVRQGSNDLVRFSQLSSGEQQIITLFSKIAVKAKNRVVFLIDEPEISLHVQWQQALPSLFSQIAEQVKCDFVIATHSPTLIANARDKLSHCFLAKELEIKEIPTEQRHSVETILLEGFKTYTPHNREVHERCAALVSRAIKQTNQGGRINIDLRDEMIEELKAMIDVMERSVQDKGKRYKQDLELVTQAQRAIRETYAMAQKESQA